MNENQKQTDSDVEKEIDTTLTEGEVESMEELIEARTFGAFLNNVDRMMKAALELNAKMNKAIHPLIESSKKLNDFMQDAFESVQKIGEAIQVMGEEADEETKEALDYLLVEKGFVLNVMATPDKYVEFYNKCKEIEQSTSNSDALLEELYVATINGTSKNELIEGLDSQAEYLPEGWSDFYIQAAKHIENHGVADGTKMTIYPMFALLENVCFEIFELVNKEELERIKKPNMHHVRTNITASIENTDYFHPPRKTLEMKVLESMRKHIYTGFGRLDTSSSAGRNSILHGHFKYEEISVIEFLRVYNTVNFMNLMRYWIVVMQHDDEE